MAIANNIDRSHPFVATAVMSPANQGAGNGVKANVPPGALLLRVAVQTATAFDGTTPTMTATDGTTVFANAVDISTAGAETVSNAPKFYPNGGSITFSTAGASTVGLAFGVLEYVIPGNAVAGVQQ